MLPETVEQTPRRAGVTTVAPTAKPLGEGDRIGSYVIDNLLAEGGMGCVYVAHHVSLPRRAAVKVLRPELAASSFARDGLFHEARVLEWLSAPRAVKLYDVGVLGDGRPWIAMELVNGRCLAQLIERGRVHSLRWVARVIAAVADALAQAHARGIVHGDIKPENIIVHDEAGGLTVKLVDWGIARSSTQKQAVSTTSGTPQYMPPEQIRGEPLDERADVYALGVLAYELVAGRLPFEGADAGALFVAHLNSTPRPARDFCPELPSELDTLLHAMLAKSSSDRPGIAFVHDVMTALATGNELPALVFTQERGSDHATERGGHASLPDASRIRWTPQQAPQTPTVYAPRFRSLPLSIKLRTRS